MGSSSKELLRLEHMTSSPLESVLLVCKKDAPCETKEHSASDNKLTTTPVPQSQVLGKVKDFLGVLSEANKRLQEDAKDNSEKHDIEVLTGNESEVIEMDLMLGIADLHTPGAVAAAESAIAAGQSLIPVMDGSSEAETEDTSDDSDSEDESDDDHNGDLTNSDNDGSIRNTSRKHKLPQSDKDDSSKAGGQGRSKKQPKIIELS